MSTVCNHERVATDNIVTFCCDCDEQWSAVTLVNWPDGCATLRFYKPATEACSCGTPWSTHPQGHWCPRCDALMEQGE